MFKGWFGTPGGNRTHTILLSLDFESSASTNSATEAWNVGAKIEIFFIAHQRFLMKNKFINLQPEIGNAVPYLSTLCLKSHNPKFFHADKVYTLRKKLRRLMANPWAKFLSVLLVTGSFNPLLRNPFGAAVFLSSVLLFQTPTI